MRILGIILFEFLLGYILQAFSVVLGLYAFNKQKIEIRKFIITSLCVSVVFFVTRHLPVAFGVHTLLNFVVMFLLGVFYLRLPIVGTISTNLLINVIVFTIESIDVVVFTLILGQSKFIAYIGHEPERSLIGLATSILFAGIVILIYYLFVYRNISKRLINYKGFIDESIGNFIV